MTASGSRLRLVGSRSANLFMTELLEVIAGELRAMGEDADVAFDEFPPLERDTVYVVIPHEFFGVVEPDHWPSDAQMAQTIALCVEQPDAIWFGHALPHAARAGAVLDVSRVGRLGLLRHGLRAGLLRLGYAEALDGWRRDTDADRPIDVLYMGSAAPRRELFLASYGPVLASRETRLMVPPHTAKTSERPDFAVGAHKHEILRQAKILLSVRRVEAPYFEWVRALDAICNGAVLVCDHSAGYDPLVPGEHFVSGAPESLAFLADELLNDAERLDRMRLAAYDFVRSELRLRDGLEALTDAARGLRGASARTRALPAIETPSRPDPAPDPAVGGHEDLIAAAHKTHALAKLERHREEARARIAAAGGDPDELATILHSPGYDAAAPRVTVCVPAYENAAELPDALASVAAQDFDSLELIVHDDASEDGCVAVAAAWLAQRPWLPALVVSRRANAGLPQARNAMTELARGEFVLMLDADNELYQPAVSRLVAALDGDPGALFSYPILACYREGEPDGLLSYLPWEPELLRGYNPIDALALLRRRELIELGGYTDDLRMHGWEDYDLWCRVAENGMHGVHVPQMLARYRRSAGSMLSLTDLDYTEMRTLLRERYPRTMAAGAASQS